MSKSKIKLRGFGSMAPKRHRELARKGGRTAHLRGTAHEFTPETAALAGKRGGDVLAKRAGYMARIGRAGGLASAAIGHGKEVSR